MKWIDLFYLHSKASDGKTICNFAIHFSTNGTHLGGIEKKIASGKLGKLAVDKALAKKGTVTSLLFLFV